MNHYYSKNPVSKSERMEWDASILGKTLQFVTDSGVFSKNRIDTGSQVLIETAAKSEFPVGDFLDIGCGYGPVGLFLSKQFPERSIDMVDVNARALELAKENSELNAIENVLIYESDLYSNVEGKKYAAIFSNPPIRAGKKVVHKILEEAVDYLVEDGVLQVVIQKKQGAPSAQKKMKAVFGNVERIALDKGYWILESRK